MYHDQEKRRDEPSYNKLLDVNAKCVEQPPVNYELDQLYKNLAILRELFQQTTDKFSKVVSPTFYNSKKGESVCKEDAKEVCELAKNLRRQNATASDLICDFEYFLKNCEL